MEFRIDDRQTESYETLGARVRELHERMLTLAPDIQRVACILYDAVDDTLKTFVNSTREGEALRSYEAKLSESYSLSSLAKTGQSRVLTDIPNDMRTGTPHSEWVIGMGYLSSLTIPLKFQDRLLGFLFFDSSKHDTFSPELQRELTLYSRLIALGIANELIVIQSVLGSVQMAQDFAEMRDLETGEHLSRIARYARMIAKDLAGPFDKTDEWVEDIFLYSPLHDIGKIGIPDSVLLKPGRLTEQEYDLMKTHSTIGLELVDSIVSRLVVQNQGSTAIMRAVVELHHEMLDGSGYPRGLRGAEIPLEAQVVSVADIFDALTSKRPYKEPWSFDAAFEELHLMVKRGKLNGDAVDSLESHRVEAAEVSSRFVEEFDESGEAPA